MNLSMKCMKLDYLLLKPYLKSMLLVLLVPLLITFFTGTLFEGLSFAATVMAMTTGYTFSVVEKNSMERFYGFLPAKKKRPGCWKIPDHIYNGLSGPASHAGRTDGYSAV